MSNPFNLSADALRTESEAYATHEAGGPTSSQQLQPQQTLQQLSANSTIRTWYALLICDRLFPESLRVASGAGMAACHESVHPAHQQHQHPAHQTFSLLWLTMYAVAVQQRVGAVSSEVSGPI